MKEIKLGKAGTVALWNISGKVLSLPSYQFYLSTDCVYLITFNAANLNYPNLEYWCCYLKSMIRKSPDSKIFVYLIGTHADCCDADALQKTIQILKEKFANYNFNFVVDIIPVSCKSQSGLVFFAIFFQPQ